MVKNVGNRIYVFRFFFVDTLGPPLSAMASEWVLRIRSLQGRNNFKLHEWNHDELR